MTVSYQPVVGLEVHAVLETLANDAPARPIGARQRLVDDGHHRRIGRILFGEVTPFDQPDTHGLEVTRTDDGFVGSDRIFIGLVDPRNEDSRDADVGAQRQVIGQRRRLDLGLYRQIAA